MYRAECPECDFTFTDFSMQIARNNILKHARQMHPSLPVKGIDVNFVKEEKPKNESVHIPCPVTDCGWTFTTLDRGEVDGMISSHMYASHPVLADIYVARKEAEKMEKTESKSAVVSLTLHARDETSTAAVYAELATFAAGIIRSHGVDFSLSVTRYSEGEDE